jgi:hypothetical protein
VCIDKVMDVPLELAASIFSVVGASSLAKPVRNVGNCLQIDTTTCPKIFEPSKYRCEKLHFALFLFCLQMCHDATIVQITVVNCYLFTLTLVLTDI